MDPQLFLHSERPRPEFVEPISNPETPIPKPEGGIWTSTGNTTSAWLEWCQREGYWPHDPTRVFKLVPEDDLNIYEIDSLTDLKAMLEEAGTVNPESAFVIPNFERLATSEYDGIHLTEAGEADTRYSSPTLYGWDTECTLFFDWCFESVEELGTVDT